MGRSTFQINAQRKRIKERREQRAEERVPPTSSVPRIVVNTSPRAVPPKTAKAKVETFTPEVHRDLTEITIAANGAIATRNQVETDARKKLPTLNVSNNSVGKDLREIAQGTKLIAAGSHPSRIGSGEVVEVIRGALYTHVQNKDGLPISTNPQSVDDNFQELVKRFQTEYAAAHGLPSSFVDGLFGNATLAALNSVANPNPSVEVEGPARPKERERKVDEIMLGINGVAVRINNPEFETRSEDLSLNTSTNLAREDLSLVAAGRKTIAAGPGKKRIGSAPVVGEVRKMLGDLVAKGYISGEGIAPSSNPNQVDQSFKELVTRFQTQYASNKGLSADFIDGLFGTKTLAALRNVSQETSREVTEHVQAPMGSWSDQSTSETDLRLSYKGLVMPEVKK